MHLILTGATGLVGSAVLRAMINTPSVTQVSVISRREVKQASGHPKVQVLLHKDFEKYDSELMEKLKDADGVVWALGISQVLVSKEEYIKITKDYPLAFVRALSDRPSPCTFVYVSGEGATQNPGLLTALFGRVKGETETELLNYSASTNGKLPVYAVRPGAVDPSAQLEIKDYIPEFKGFMGTFKTPIFGAVKRMYSSMHTPTKEMGEIMVQLASSKGNALDREGVESGGRIVTNVGLRRLAGL